MPPDSRPPTPASASAPRLRRTLPVISGLPRAISPWYTIPSARRHRPAAAGHNKSALSAESAFEGVNPLDADSALFLYLGR